jgi:hypothetical protein
MNNFNQFNNSQGSFPHPSLMNSSNGSLMGIFNNGGNNLFNNQRGHNGQRPLETPNNRPRLASNVRTERNYAQQQHQGRQNAIMGQRINHNAFEVIP